MYYKVNLIFTIEGDHAHFQTTTNESTEIPNLKTLAELGACEAPVVVAQIAERLEVSTVSANEMMQRLDAQGLVARQRYKGIELTDDGRAIARSVTAASDCGSAFWPIISD